MSIFTVLAVVFITLKLAGVIYWSWIAVLAPLWAPWLVLLVIMLGASIVGAVRR